jgi:ubiquinone/menaquinone biosynthesis C-methylase UbiE
MRESYHDWDRVYREYPLEALPWELGRPREVLVRAIESGKVKPGKALDICCGAGTNTVYMAQKSFRVTGLDISTQAIKYAKEKAREARVKIRFIVGNALDFPFEDQEFDFVFDMGCFHHVLIEDREKFIQGLCRILKEDKGQYLLVCFSDRNGPAWNHFTKQQLITLFSTRFKFQSVEHFGSVEADGYTRFFYSVLMKRFQKPCKNSS